MYPHIHGSSKKTITFFVKHTTIWVAALFILLSYPIYAQIDSNSYYSTFPICKLYATEERAIPDAALDARESKSDSGESADSPSTKEQDKKEGETKDKDDKKDDKPLFIGTLLAIFGENVAPGKLLVEPYIFINRIYGAYDPNWKLIRDRHLNLYTFFVTLETGITEEIDTIINLAAMRVYNRHRHATNLGDIQVSLGFQIAKDKKECCTPDIRILLSEYFPTGKYQYLDPLLLGGDVTGAGAFGTAISFVVGKAFYHLPNHPYSINANATMVGYAHAPIASTSIYGGDENTRGQASPGERFIFNLAYEYKFNPRWGWGVDFHYEYQNRSTLRVYEGSPLMAGTPSSSQFSMAPEIEYNQSENMAVSIAFWYSLYGKNAPAYFVGALNFAFQF